jgi:hypothetical protein
MEVSGHLHAPYCVTPSIHCIGGWLGPRAGLDITEKSKVSYPCWEMNPNSSCHPAHSLVSIPTELSQLPENYLK